MFHPVLSRFASSVNKGLLLSLLFLSGCAQLSQVEQKPSGFYDLHQDRTTLLSNIQQWQIKGQIAFIQPDKRERASIFWQRQEDSQSVNLTTYLGINVLSLSTEQGQHELEVDGKTYHTQQLDRLIWQLTGLTFPSDALPYWIKAIPYSDQDSVELSEEDRLPSSITSHYNNQIWTIHYQAYKDFQGVQLPTAILVKQQGMTIKLAIRQWTI